MTYAEKLALYEKLVATNPDVPRKGDTMPYTSLNGNMFTLLTKEGTLILRLDPDNQAAFLKKYKSKLHKMTITRHWAVDNVRRTKDQLREMPKAHRHLYTW